MVLRLFAALVPPPPVLDHLDGALDGVRAGAAAALRWVPRENLHLTLAFYGEVPDGAVPALTDGLMGAAASSSPAEVALRGAGSFGGTTLWVGLTGDVPAVRRLMDDAHEAGGLRPGERNRPHLTVARGGRRSRGLDLSGAVRALSVYGGPSWTATEIALVSSRLGQGRAGGPRYALVAQAPLGGGA